MEIFLCFLMLLLAVFPTSEFMSMNLPFRSSLKKIMVDRREAVLLGWVRGGGVRGSLGGGGFLRS